MYNFTLPQWGTDIAAPAATQAPPMGFGQAPVTSATGYTPLQFGMNIPTMQLGLQGLGALGGLWSGLQANKMAKANFNFTKEMAQKNLANSIQSYNTALTDRATSRGFVQGDSAQKTQDYINSNKI